MHQLQKKSTALNYYLSQGNLRVQLFLNKPFLHLTDDLQRKFSEIKRYIQENQSRNDPNNFHMKRKCIIHILCQFEKPFLLKTRKINSKE